MLSRTFDLRKNTKADLKDDRSLTFFVKAILKTAFGIEFETISEGSKSKKKDSYGDNHIKGLDINAQWEFIDKYKPAFFEFPESRDLGYHIIDIDEDEFDPLDK